MGKSVRAGGKGGGTGVVKRWKGWRGVVKQCLLGLM